MRQQGGTGGASTVIDLGLRPTRIYAPFMLVACVCSTLIAVWLLAHSWAGVVVVAEGGPGTAIALPAARNDALDVYAVVRPGQSTPEVTCELAPTSSSWVGLPLDSSLVPPTSKGRALKLVAKVYPGWHNGVTLTCKGDDVKTLLLGHNAGMTYLLQGLLASFLALGSGLIALIGIASRRHRARAMAAPGGPDRSRV